MISQAHDFIQCESIGGTSYAVVSYNATFVAIPYQCRMLEQNAEELSGLLRYRSLERNGVELGLYDITSKLALSQALTHGRLNPAQFTTLFVSILETILLCDEYQLPTKGLILAPEHIYIDPTSYRSSLLYLPTSTTDVGVGEIFELMRHLIMGNYIDGGASNFVSQLLELTNKPLTSLQDLQKQLLQLRGNGPVAPVAPVAPVRPMQPAQPVAPVQPVQPARPVAPAPQQGSPAIPGKPGAIPGKPGGVPGAAAKKAPAKQKEKKSGGVSIGGIVIMVLLQPFLLIAIGMLWVNDVLSSAQGDLDMAKLAGVIIACLAIEFLAGRRYLAPTNAAPKEAKSAKAAKPAKATKPTKGKKPPVAPPAPPRQTPPAQPMMQPQQPQQQQPYTPPAAYPSAGNQATVPNAPIPGNLLGDDATVALGYTPMQQTRRLVLETYTNGTLQQIPISRENFRIGRMRDQVDFQVLDCDKVGRVHASFTAAGDVLYVTDLNSRNGTFINGNTTPIPPQTPLALSNNDWVTLGSKDFTVKLL